MNMFKNIRELPTSLRNNFEIISGKIPRSEIKLFQTDVDEG